VPTHGSSFAGESCDGCSKLKAANNHHKIFTSAKVERGRKQLDEAVSRHLRHLDATDRREKLEKLRSELDKLMAIEAKFPVADVFSYVEVVD
jgi:hypothetical protein